MNLFWSPLSLPSPQGGERVAEGRERGWFMERLSGDYSLVWNVRRWPPAGMVTT